MYAIVVTSTGKMHWNALTIRMNEWDGFNIGRSTQWDFDDGLDFNQKADPKTIGLAILILRQVAGYRFAKVPKEVLLIENLKDIAPTTDFACTRRPWVRGEPRVRRFTDQATPPP